MNTKQHILLERDDNNIDILTIQEMETAVYVKILEKVNTSNTNPELRPAGYGSIALKFETGKLEKIEKSMGDLETIIDNLQSLLERMDVKYKELKE